MSLPMEMFKDAQNTNIIDSTIENVAGNQYRAGTMYINNSISPDTSDLNRILAPVHDAAFSRGGYVARCHPGTRETLIANIKSWSRKLGGPPICWLNGPAGSGKSAVSQTIAEWCNRKDKLAASFFFLRGAGDQSTFRHFLPTLAYQLSVSVPATKPYIKEALQSNETITTHSLKHQFEKLIVKPMLKVRKPVLAKFPIWDPMVVIVDALDECDDRDVMAQFIKVVIDACRENRPFPFRVFFTSRVEEHIRQMLATSEARSTMYTLALQDFDATIDIRKFFQSRLATVYEQKSRYMGNVPQPWPSKSELNALVEKASGSFILASTIINFIDDGDLPHVKLPMASNLPAGLDHIYTQVLSAIPPSQIFERAISTIILVKSPLSITALGYMLQLEAINILQALIGVQSILMIPGSDDEPVRLFHTSLRDFMTTELRSGNFFVDPPVGHLAIATNCLRVLTIPPKGIIFEGEVQSYACENWCHHFYDGLVGLLDSSLGSSLMTYLTNLLHGSFDCWVNTLIFTSHGRSILDIFDLMLSKLGDSPKQSQGIIRLLKDVRRRLKSDSNDFWEYFRAAIPRRFMAMAAFMAAPAVPVTAIQDWREDQHKRNTAANVLLVAGSSSGI